MKFLFAVLASLIIMMIPAIPGSSILPKDIQVYHEAVNLDIMLEKELNSYKATVVANEMDKRRPPNYTADGILENYFVDKESTRYMFRGMKTRDRRELLKQIIERMAELYIIDPNLVKAVAKQESHYNPDAVSPVGAVGIMQLMPATAKEVGVKDRRNPVENIEGGIKYLIFLQKKFPGNLKKVIAGYNAGPNAVIKHNGIPPYDETVDYVKRVLKHRKEYQKL